MTGMPKLKISTKRLMIDKANRKMVLVIAIASFVTVFSVVACRALSSQRAYQSRVTAEKEKAVKQLKSNLDAVKSLETSYQGFVNTSANILGGNPKGTGDKDGDNAKIVLDALPSKYDFPALTASVEKLLTNQNYSITSISGTDDEVNQEGHETSIDPQPVEMPFTLAISTNFGSLQNLFSTLERSIRPIQFQKLNMTATGGEIQVTLDASTYYQPAKSLNFDTKVVQ